MGKIARNVEKNPEPMYNISYSMGESYTKEESDKVQMANLFNWYAMYRNKNDARKYISEYTKTYQQMLGYALNLNSIPDDERVSTLGWCCRQATLLGHESIPEVMCHYIQTRLSTLKTVAAETGLPVKAAKIPKPHIPISDLVRMKIERMFEETSSGFLSSGNKFDPTVIFKKEKIKPQTMHSLTKLVDKSSLSDVCKAVFLTKANAWLAGLKPDKKVKPKTQPKKVVQQVEAA